MLLIKEKQKYMIIQIMIKNGEIIINTNIQYIIKHIEIKIMMKLLKENKNREIIINQKSNEKI